MQELRRQTQDPAVGGPDRAAVLWHRADDGRPPHVVIEHGAAPGVSSRIVREADVDGPIVAVFQWDACGRILACCDSERILTRYVRDGTGRVVRVERSHQDAAATERWELAYHEEGGLAYVCDGAGRRHALGRTWFGPDGRLAAGPADAPDDIIPAPRLPAWLRRTQPFSADMPGAGRGAS